MSKKFMRKLDRMGRRRFLNTLGGLGLSATTLSFITKDALAETTSDVTEEVPYVKLLRHTNHEEVKRGAAPEREPIWDTIKNNEGDDTYEVKKQGNKTGTTTGYIIDTVEKSTGERNYWTNADIGGGDSGGPHFRRVQFSGNDETYIVGIAAWGRGSDSCPNPESGGNSMEYIEDHQGLTV